jgi:hypothetical protein
VYTYYPALTPLSSGLLPSESYPTPPFATPCTGPFLCMYRPVPVDTRPCLPYTSRHCPISPPHTSQALPYVGPHRPTPTHTAPISARTAGFDFLHKIDIILLLHTWRYRKEVQGETPPRSVTTVRGKATTSRTTLI